ncbi:MAG: phosphoribosyltransferase family protein [bacterium]|nr:phosphoribosyltransferase family protein [bacterium]
MLLYKYNMRFLSLLKDSVLSFLFPTNREVARLESLAPHKILEILPPALVEDDRNIVALFDYKDPLVRELIWQVKYTGNRTIAEKLGVILYDVICDDLSEQTLLGKNGAAIIMPIPISDKRRFERGWNQAELLTREIKKCDRAKVFKYLPGQLVKHRHTESQTKTSSRQERLENIKGSMRILNPAQVQDRCVVLVDDVSTTGATFNEAKRVLKEAGAKKILCVAVAH